MTMPSMRRSSTRSIARRSRSVFSSVLHSSKIVALAALVGRVLDAAHEIGEEWVGDVGDQHGDGSGLGDAQAARYAVRPVFQRLDRRLTFFLASTLTAREPLTTCETVAVDTPAFRATSLMVAMKSPILPAAGHVKRFSGCSQ